MPDIIKVIVGGTRTFADYPRLKRILDKYLLPLKSKGLMVLHGNCEGPDKLAEKWCIEHLIPFQRHPADWKNQGNTAGPIRNTEMVKVADRIIAFWDGESSGTKDILFKAKRKGLKCKVIRI